MFVLSEKTADFGFTGHFLALHQISIKYGQTRWCESLLNIGLDKIGLGWIRLTMMLFPSI